MQAIIPVALIATGLLLLLIMLNGSISFELIITIIRAIASIVGLVATIGL